MNFFPFAAADTHEERCAFVVVAPAAYT